MGDDELGGGVLETDEDGVGSLTVGAMLWVEGVVVTDADDVGATVGLGLALALCLGFGLGRSDAFSGANCETSSTLTL